MLNQITKVLLTERRLQSTYHVTRHMTHVQITKEH